MGGLRRALRTSQNPSVGGYARLTPPYKMQPRGSTDPMGDSQGGERILPLGIIEALKCTPFTSHTHTVKQKLQKLIEQALKKLVELGGLQVEAQPTIEIQRTRDPAHGDFASNIALMLAKPARRNPRELAQAIAAGISTDGFITKVEVAGPGFINFFLSGQAFQQLVSQVLVAGVAYGRSEMGAGRRVQVEFVSANPNGPLHIGHGRGAASGAVLARLLEEVGYTVHREYYVNDVGRQMDILTVSVWLRYLESQGETIVFPEKGYRGDYVREIAAQLEAESGKALHVVWQQFVSGLPADGAGELGNEKTADHQADNYVARAKSCLGEDNYRRVFELGLHAMLNIIREDLANFGVTYDRWFSERSLITDGAVERALERLRAAGQIYEQDGAQWFRARPLGMKKIGWWCARTASRLISLTTSPTISPSSNAALTLPSMCGAPIITVISRA